MAGIEVQHLMGTTHRWIRVKEHHLKTALETSRRLGIRHTPTIVTYERASLLAREEKGPSHGLAKLLPRYYPEILWNPKVNLALNALTDSQFEDLPARVMHMSSLVGRLYAEGVPIFAGTDTPNPFVVPGESLHRELSLLADAGLGIEGAWRAATCDAGRALGVDKLGTLASGAPGDLLIFREDPSRDLEALSTLVAVVSQGRIYRKETLNAALAPYRTYFKGSLYETLSTAAARLVVGWRRN
jgi:hypothetical protein